MKQKIRKKPIRDKGLLALSRAMTALRGSQTRAMLDANLAFINNYFNTSLYIEPKHLRIGKP